MQQVLADSQFNYGGQPKWDAERALDFAAHLNVEDDIPAALHAAKASIEPATPAWFGQRLTVLRAMFSVGRSVEQGVLTVWMAEVARLLRDLPADILAHSVDEAVKTCSHGFIPSVGEIRAIADPLAHERCQHIQRLERMTAALSDPAATEQRMDRRREQRAHDEHHRRMSEAH